MDATVIKERAYILNDSIVLCLEEPDVRDVRKVDHVDALFIATSCIEMVVPDNHAAFMTIGQVNTGQSDFPFGFSGERQVRVLVLRNIDLASPVSFFSSKW